MAERVSLDTVSEILGVWKTLKAEGHTRRGASDIIGIAHSLMPTTVEGILKRYAPTTQLATHYLQARAMKLAVRVVRKANTSEAIDILSRPNIGVLEPARSKEGGLGGGFFLSVQVGDLGAVRGQVQPSLPAASVPATYIEGASYENAEPENADAQGPDAQGHAPLDADHAPHVEDRGEIAPDPRPSRYQGGVGGRRVGPGHSQKVQAAIAEAKARIEARRAEAQHRTARRGGKHTQHSEHHGV